MFPLRKLKVPMLSVVVLSIATTIGIQASAGATADVLLSQSMPVTASSVEDGTFLGSRAVDGSTTTRWASAEGIDPQWIRVDLGQPSMVNRLKLNWEAAYAKQYRIEISDDGQNFQTVKTITTGDGGIDDHTSLAAHGRYVRVVGTQRGTPYGYSLWELEAFGVSDSTGDTEAPTVPTGLTASNVRATGATLNWTASTDNVGVSGYDVLRNGTVAASVATNSFSDTGLTPQTSYSYTVRAKDPAGNLSAPSTAVTVTTAAAADVLLSRSKPVTVSSSEGSGFLGSRAVDGSTTTRWASAEGVDPQWIRVDLGKSSVVNRLRLNWEVAYAKQYRIEISEDGQNFQTLKTVTAGDGGIDDHTGLGAQGRYVRVVGTQRGTAWGYSLWELEVFGVGDGGGDNGEFVLAAAGDIADQCTASSSSCVHPKTARVVDFINPVNVITMGDNQYDDAHYSDFTNYFNTSWGRFKSIMKPSVGNHETYSSPAYDGYHRYFGSIARPNGKRYYSWERGNWHFIALDSTADSPGLVESEQHTWLKADLAANTKKCVAAYYHHPRYSSGSHGDNPKMTTMWNILVDNGVDLVLNGHDHHYERFVPQDKYGKPNAAGPLQIVGGMGGTDNFYPVHAEHEATAKTITDTHGVLKLTMTDNSFTTQLIGLNNTVLDSSPTTSCH